MKKALLAVLVTVISAGAFGQSDYRPTLANLPFVVAPFLNKGSSMGAGSILFDFGKDKAQAQFTSIRGLGRDPAQSPNHDVMMTKFFRFAVSGKPTDGFSTLFDGRNLMGQVSASIMTGFNTVRVGRDNSAELGVYGIEVEVSSSSYKTVADPSTPVIKDESTTGYSARLTGVRTFGDVALSLSAGYQRGDNSGALKKGTFRETLFSGGTIQGFRDVNGLIGNLKMVNQIPLQVELIKYLDLGLREEKEPQAAGGLNVETFGKPKDFEVAVSLFGNYNAGQGERVLVPGAAMYFLKPGAPAVPLGGVYLQVQDGRARLGIFAGLSF